LGFGVKIVGEVYDCAQSYVAENEGEIGRESLEAGEEKAKSACAMSPGAILV